MLLYRYLTNSWHAGQRFVPIIFTLVVFYLVSKLYIMQADWDGQDNRNDIPEFSNDTESWLHSEAFRFDGDQGDDLDHPD